MQLRLHIRGNVSDRALLQYMLSMVMRLACLLLKWVSGNVFYKMENLFSKSIFTHCKNIESTGHLVNLIFIQEKYFCYRIISSMMQYYFILEWKMQYLIICILITHLAQETPHHTGRPPIKCYNIDCFYQSIL